MLLGLGLPTPALETTELVERNGEIYGVLALEVICCAVPPRDLPCQLITQEALELLPVRDKGASLARYRKKCGATLTAKREHDVPAIERERLFPTMKASLPVGHSTKDSPCRLAETLKEASRV